MDDIQPYREHPATPAPSRATAITGHSLAHQAGHTPPSVPKVPSDYLRALRRRVWLVLVISVPLGVMTSIWALRQPAIYQAKTEIIIEPPEHDPMLTALVAREIGTRNPAGQSQYVPNRLAQLQSTGMAEQVVSDSRVVNEMNQFADPARELLNCIQVKSIPKTSWSLITIENRDPVLAKKLLETLIDKFTLMVNTESEKSIEVVKLHAETNLANLKKQKETLDRLIEEALVQNARAIGPSGKNMYEDQLVLHKSLLQQKELNLGHLRQQAMMSELIPKEMKDDFDSVTRSRFAEAEATRKAETQQLKRLKARVRNYNSDPAVVYHTELLDEALKELREIEASPITKADKAGSATDLILDQNRREIEADKATTDELMTQLRASMPGYQKYLAMEDDRKRRKQEIAEAEHNIQAFDILSQSQSQQKPVRDSGNGNVKEPTVPVRPNRTITIAMGLIFSIAAGIALVCLLEHIDHRVKVPEHVTHGLTLPLLGVVPRMRRTALTHRAGHLWTPGAPDSLEADAFRNVRASLLGVADRSGPIVTLLVTSAKAGEGKSTSALNLAATCAKAGERTLLLDIDLRRGSLGDVFDEDEDGDEEDDPKRGLVDVLRGKLPWQRTVRRTPIANLDFIPTGDTFDIPIEILGTRELRQLILALSHHYDRVILDGPAILGLADCLVLGRVVDSTLLVVRSGAHQLTTLFRAKGMLEQARVPIAGVVFNSLTEGLDSWSSYVTEQPMIVSSNGRVAGNRAGEQLAGPARDRSASEVTVEDEEESFDLAAAGAGRRRA